MINYADSSDYFYVWLKRSMSAIDTSVAITADSGGCQEKGEELVVYRGTKDVEDHRTPDFFDTGLARAFAECNRVVKQDGIVTIVFGHGDPDVWRRLLGVIDKAGLVLTGSWPAQTEGGGQEGSANITTTLTMSCRPATPSRPVGKAMDVRSEIRAEVFNRVVQWEQDGLALTDQLMAAAGPAMEVAGRYAEVLIHEVNPLMTRLRQDGSSGCGRAHFHPGRRCPARGLRCGDTFCPISGAHSRAQCRREERC